MADLSDKPRRVTPAVTGGRRNEQQKSRPEVVVQELSKTVSRASLGDALPLVQNDDAPLCVDLDGSVTNTDTLFELLMVATRLQPLLLLQMPGWLGQGKARMKQELAGRIPLDVATLPYNEPLIGFLQRERARGRRIVLVTAADRRVAATVADHLGLFDEVIASDGVHNLRGAHKADALAARFGDRGFDYVGNDMTDAAVWDRARHIMLANPTAAARRYTRALEVAQVFEGRMPLWRALTRALRPHQWAKNVLVFIPFIVAGTSHEMSALGRTVLAFLALCLTASAVYVSNDLLDLAADRRHHRKRLRPFAHGDLSIAQGLGMLPLLLVAGLGLASAAGVAGIVIGYAVLSSLYSLKVKELPLVDVFMLALLYTIRLFAGGLASGHLVSMWLITFSCFIFLSLGFVKRVAELAPLQARGLRSAARRGYVPEDTLLLSAMGVASSFISGMVLALYIQSLSASAFYGNPGVLWAAVPLLLFWQCRLWLSTARGYMHDDPLVYAMRDWVSWIVGGVLALVVILAKFATPSGIPGLQFP